MNYNNLEIADENFNEHQNLYQYEGIIEELEADQSWQIEKEEVDKANRLENDIKFNKHQATMFKRLQHDVKSMNIFANKASDLGRCKIEEYAIKLKEGSRPIFTRDYPKSPHQREATIKWAKEMLEAGIIEPSRSPYQSPLY